MRKIIASILSLMLILSVFSAITVSAAVVDATEESFTFETVVDGDTATIDVYANIGSASIEYVDGAQISYVAENCEVSATTPAFEASSWVLGTTALYSSLEGYQIPGASFKVLTYKVKKTADNATFALAAGSFVADSFGDELNITDAAVAPSVELWAAGPAENVATYVTNELALDVDGEIKNFTDVPVYNATTTATSFKLKAVYGEEYNYLKFNGAEEINVSNIKVEGEGDVSFQVAIIGVPAGVTIDKLIVE